MDCFLTLGGYHYPQQDLSANRISFSWLENIISHIPLADLLPLLDFTFD